MKSKGPESCLMCRVFSEQVSRCDREWEHKLPLEERLLITQAQFPERHCAASPH